MNSTLTHFNLKYIMRHLCFFHSTVLRLVILNARTLWGFVSLVYFTRFKTESVCCDLCEADATEVMLEVCGRITRASLQTHWRLNSFILIHQYFLFHHTSFTPSSPDDRHYIQNDITTLRPNAPVLWKLCTANVAQLIETFFWLPVNGANSQVPHELTLREVKFSSHTLPLP